MGLEKWEWDIMCLVRNMELGHHELGTQRNWDTMGLGHHGLGAQWDWDTRALVHNGTGAQ